MACSAKSFIDQLFARQNLQWITSWSYVSQVKGLALAIEQKSISLFLIAYIFIPLYETFLTKFTSTWNFWHKIDFISWEISVFSGHLVIPSCIATQYNYIFQPLINVESPSLFFSWYCDIAAGRFISESQWVKNFPLKNVPNHLGLGNAAKNWTKYCNNIGNSINTTSSIYLVIWKTFLC